MESAPLTVGVMLCSGDAPNALISPPDVPPDTPARFSECAKSEPRGDRP